MAKTKISWTEYSWNPVSGCTKVSPGCDNCYAETVAERYRGGNAFPNGFDVTLRPHKIREPEKWHPSRIFVNSMSDLFHRDIPDDFLIQIWQTMLDIDKHQYQVLTKRPHRMAHKIAELHLETAPHIWLGTSTETQEFFDSRLEALASIDTDIRFVSAEPLLGPIDMRAWIDDLSWCIAGGESGADRRPMDYDWARGIRDQCVATDTAFWYKQGNHFKPGMDNVLDGRRWEQFPGDLADDPDKVAMLL